MAALASENDLARRRLLALGIVTDRLRDIGVTPVLVGGAALSFYTDGEFATGDVDLALPLGPDIDRAFADLGFEKEGRFWIIDDLRLYFEAPAPAGLPGEDAPRTHVLVDGLEVVILGVEDLLMDRIRAWVHPKSEEDHRWSVSLAALYSDRMDWDYLGRKASEVAEETAALRKLREEVEKVLEDQA